VPSHLTVVGEQIDALAEAAWQYARDRVVQMPLPPRLAEGFREGWVEFEKKVAEMLGGGWTLEQVDR